MALEHESLTERVRYHCCNLKAIKIPEDIQFAVVRSQMKALGQQSGLLPNFAKATVGPSRVAAPWFLLSCIPMNKDLAGACANGVSVSKNPPTPRCKNYARLSSDQGADGAVQGELITRLGGDSSRRGPNRLVISIFAFFVPFVCFCSKKVLGHYQGPSERVTTYSQTLNKRKRRQRRIKTEREGV